MADLGGILQCPLLSRLSDPGRKSGIKMLSLQNFSFTGRSVSRGVLSLWEPVRHADFENSARWCVVLELGAIEFPVVWGFSTAGERYSRHGSTSRAFFRPAADN